MKDITLKIQNLLNKQDSSIYKEIYNFNYDVEVDTSFMNKKIPPALNGDEVERNELIKEMVSICTKRSIESRQCVLHKSYQNDDSLAACLSTIQAISRDGKIDLHIFVRSQDFDKNFCYDNQTYMMIMCALCIQFPEKQLGKIYVHVTSLHRYIREGQENWTFC